MEGLIGGPSDAQLAPVAIRISRVSGGRSQPGEAGAAGGCLPRTRRATAAGAALGGALSRCHSAAQGAALLLPSLVGGGVATMRTVYSLAASSGGCSTQLSHTCRAPLELLAPLSASSVHPRWNGSVSYTVMPASVMARRSAPGSRSSQSRRALCEHGAGAASHFVHASGASARLGPDRTLLIVTFACLLIGAARLQPAAECVELALLLPTGIQCSTS